MLAAQMPTAPTGMVMSPYYTPILWLNIAVFAVVMFWIVKESRRTKSIVPVLMMVGAAVASLEECAFDVMVLVNWADTGHTQLYRIFIRFCQPTTASERASPIPVLS